ncbi:putative transcription elongation factor [Methylococcus capsulatus str. Bath]|uniref:Putative transcription elongation factor n=1 Tax=Methylococcus capsulatus (strain ATCC 33009 / NCIMB 11132 / Bath) TaxID=243233 RepID=Q60BR4_METCA|nr:GreA/GreB family elongation factor [Methylococcus capsulatus]AAU90456.1 putative transcription elongation factor [Methylococcus capsulatus str. Bath]
MSRAFVKETDGEDLDDGAPDRPVSPHPNYVTPAGLAQLQARVAELTAERQRLLGDESVGAKQQLRRVERELRYYDERVVSAIPVDPAARSGDRVHFGATVEVEDEAGNVQRYSIVGEDEADAAHGKISWVSPLARALLNAEAGDTVTWKRPAGDKELHILAIHPYR